MARALFLLLGLFLFSLPQAFAAGDDKDGVKPNRLIDSASPYLRQHAYNPIDWYTWGEDAFKKAKELNKPIFLSVGYSTCHWCHVMARESFVDKKIAEIVNDNFIAIKVDRERRPGVDETYMLATQLITGQGGWPNTVFMTPDLKPFYAGTYFPPDAFQAVLSQVKVFWENERSGLLEDAERISEAIKTVMTRRLEAQDLTPKVLNTVVSGMLEELDPVYGGFGDNPKFPQESTLLFLLRMAEKDGNKTALKAATHTLQNILNGGITDHVGGGFHRYAVDRKWLIPHFEKMLYNQALMTQSLLRAYRLTGEKRFERAARRALDYVIADLTHAKGGFYSARDAADADGEEGTFYIWSEKQIEDVLQGDELDFAKKAFGVTFEGNFSSGNNILHFSRNPLDMVNDLWMSLEEFRDKRDRVLVKLAEARTKRDAPHRDEKVLVSWNGMMIAAMAEGAQVLGETRYGEAARKAAEFVWTTMRDGDTLKRSWFEGKVSLEAIQDDYAYAGLGFVALYDLTGEKIWLERAEKLVATMNKTFRDKDAGDFYMTASTSTFARAKIRQDSGTPSGNSAALELFAKLSQRTTTPEHRINGEALLAAMSGIAVTSPLSNAYLLMAADDFLRGGAGAQQFLSRGVVRADATYDKASGALKVRLRLKDGWHVNSHKPLEEFFIPTKLAISGEGDAQVSYPEDKKIRLGFHDKDIAVYEGEVTLTAKLPEAPKDAVMADLEIQACSDKICLNPETAQLRVPVHPAK